MNIPARVTKSEAERAENTLAYPGHGLRVTVADVWRRSGRFPEVIDDPPKEEPQRMIPRYTEKENSTIPEFDINEADRARRESKRLQERRRRSQRAEYWSSAIRAVGDGAKYDNVLPADEARAIEMRRAMWGE